MVCTDAYVKRAQERKEDQWILMETARGRLGSPAHRCLCEEKNGRPVPAHLADRDELLDRLVSLVP